MGQLERAYTIASKNIFDNLGEYTNKDEDEESTLLTQRSKATLKHRRKLSPLPET